MSTDLKTALIRAAAVVDQHIAECRDTIMELPADQRATWLETLASLKRSDARKMTARQWVFFRQLATVAAIQVMQSVYPLDETDSR